MKRTIERIYELSESDLREAIMFWLQGRDINAPLDPDNDIMFEIGDCGDVETRIVWREVI